MKQYEAVIKVMEANGGYATLGYLNQHVLKVEDCEWKTKTPFASIRRIVQDKRFFFKVRPGLWALRSYKDKLPPAILPEKSQPKTKQEEYSHAYYQGLLVELGNFKRFKTFVPKQDKNKFFLDRKLSAVATLTDVYEFGYDHIVRIAKTVDVTWFNERKMPASLFEVEHSTPMHRSLVKFVEFQDLNTNFCIVADGVRRKEFLDKLSLDAYRPVCKRVKFWSYEDLVDYHTKTSEIISIESRIML